MKLAKFRRGLFMLVLLASGVETKIQAHLKSGLISEDLIMENFFSLDKDVSGASLEFLTHWWDEEWFWVDGRTSAHVVN